MMSTPANEVAVRYRQSNEEEPEETVVQLAVGTPAAQARAPVPRRQPGLLMVEGPATGRRYRLAGVVRIGRAPTCEIAVCSPRVSRDHAALRSLPDGRAEIEDLGSSNGTFVNGRPVRRQVLRMGDRITLGGAITFVLTTIDPEEERAREAQMMEVLGRLGAGIAHDFNNMLATVMATMEYLRGLPCDRNLSDPDVAECLEDISQATDDAASMVSRLTDALRKPTEDRESTVDLSRLCLEMARLLRRLLPRAIELVCDVPPGLRVRGDAAALRQLVLNLALNARDAMPSGGSLFLRARQVDGYGTDAGQAGAGVLVEVEDTGTGMDAATRDRALEPLFTTKQRGTGTGLGLATVADVTRSHGGRVEIESEVGRGTTFRIRLPTHAPTPHGRRPQPTLTERVARDGSERPPPRVLIVDDEELVSRSTARLLRRAGHEVVSVGTATAAIEQFRHFDSTPDVVVLDLDMPGMGGEECHARLRELDPSVRVVYLTGHWDSERERAGRARGGLAFLRKPCPGKKLVDTIEGILRPNDRVAHQEDDPEQGHPPGPTGAPEPIEPERGRAG